MKGYIAQVYVTEEDGLVYINNYGDCKGISDAFFLTTEELLEIKDELLGMEEDDALQFIGYMITSIFNKYMSIMK
jgi:hypothetical protein